MDEDLAASSRWAHLEAIARLIEDLDDVVWVLDLDTSRFTYVSRSVERLRGLTPAEVLAEDAMSALAPGSREHLAAVLPARIAAFESGVDLRYVDEIEQPHRDGSVVWTETSTRFSRDVATGHLLVAGSSRDISERRRAERAARESDDRLRRALANIPNAVVIYDRDLRVKYLNPASVDLTGRPSSERLGRRDEDLWPREVCERWLPAVRRARDTGETQSLEIEIMTATSPRALHVACVPLRDERGEVRDIVGIAHEVTGARDAERALRAELAVREQFAMVAASVPGVVYSYRERPGGNACMPFTTPAVMDVFGLTSETVARDMSAWFANMEPGDGRRLAQGIEASARAGAPWHDVFRYRHPIKGARWIEGWSVPKKLPDGSVEWHGFAMDVSEQKHAEEQLRALAADLELRVAERTAELSRAVRAKDEFLASTSHELRTPLNGILGLSEILADDVYGPLTDKQRKAIARIEESGRHLLSLINDILDVAKVEAGKLELAITPLDVADVCRAGVRLVQQAAHHKQIDLGAALAPDLPTIHGDERRLKQVVVNLLTNAVKFTPEGGRVGISAALTDDGASVRIVVSDSGIGIAEEDMGRLFQPFVQLDSRLSREQPGTGLGLALVRRLVDLHGGSVGLDSELGRGTRFSVTLPLRRAAPASTHVEAASIAPRSGSGGRRLLVAEDDENNVTTLRDFLEVSGYEVHVARDGREAVAMTDALSPELILMDIQMPVLDGLAAIRAIRSSGRSISKTPIIALTALAMPGDEQRCLTAGADGYLTKPVSLKRLSKAIEDILARGRERA